MKDKCMPTYFIVQEPSAYHLADRVQEFIRQGYAPLGGPFIAKNNMGEDVYHQAMVPR